MAELAASTGVTLVSTIATSVAQARGLRVTFDSTGTTSAAAIGVRGDYITAQAIAASGVGAAVSPQAGIIVPVISNGGGAIAVGDTIYSAASGKTSTTSTSAVLLGKAVTAAAATDGVLYEVLLQNPA